jgi:hypothetical protein
MAVNFGNLGYRYKNRINLSIKILKSDKKFFSFEGGIEAISQGAKNCGRESSFERPPALNCY